jgi:hypothetical protein
MNQAEFQEEVPDLVCSDEELSDERTNVSIVFAPKHHSEITGEGIKNG